MHNLYCTVRTQKEKEEREVVVTIMLAEGQWSQLEQQQKLILLSYSCSMPVSLLLPVCHLPPAYRLPATEKATQIGKAITKNKLLSIYQSTA